jgi:hypothetical protein
LQQACHIGRYGGLAARPRLQVEKVITRIFDGEKGQSLIEQLMPAAKWACVDEAKFAKLTKPGSTPRQDAKIFWGVRRP